jgi:hypothetical protein
VTIQNDPLTETRLPGVLDTTTRTSWDTQAHTWQECRYSVAVTGGLMAAIERIPSHCSSGEVQERLWDVLWKASLSARRAKPGCARIVFEVILPIEGTREKYQTLILNIRPGNTLGPLGMIGFPADFCNVSSERRR